MKIERCYEILEVGPGASLDEVHKAYRDSVSVWHPDRFREGNPRVIKKAEEKIKQINEAYETLVSVCSRHRSAREYKTQDGPRAFESASGDYRKRQPSGEKGREAFSSRTEAVAEAGTRIVLTASSQLMKIVRRWIDSGGS